MPTVAEQPNAPAPAPQPPVRFNQRTNPLRSRKRSRPLSAPLRDSRAQIDDSTGWSKPLLWRLIALAIVLMAFLLPRLHELDRLVTPDEPIWLARSANFYQALSSGDLGSTYQFAHPGVTVMWLGAAGYWWKANDYADLVDGQISQRQNRVARVLEDQGYDPLDVLVAGRTILIVGMALAFAAAFLMTLRLLEFWVVLLGFMLIALDPFEIAITRLLHVDGIASVLTLLSVVAGLVYLLRGKRRSDLIISGVAAGLAVLTRSQLGVIAIWFAFMLMVNAHGWQLGLSGWSNALRQSVRPLLIWGLSALVTCIVLWPALWVDPIHVARGMLDFAETAALEGHERAIFFAGLVYDGDPGWRFYPATFFWRATPVVIFGVFAGILALIRSRRWSLPVAERRIILSLLIAGASYGLLMSVAAKKFDRYLLPMYPLLALVAAWGLLTVIRRWSPRLPGPAWATAAVTIGLAVAIQMSGVTASAPYYLSYYNPMLGGASRAPSAMMVGWGEGLDQVAEFLNDEHDGEEIVVASESWSSTLSYFLDGDVRLAAFVDDPKGIYRWAGADYYLLYVTPQTRGQVWQPFLQSLSDTEPVLTVNLNGLDYATLYEIRDRPVPAYLETGRTGMVLWERLGRMVASTRAVADRAGSAGSVLREVIYFDNLATSDLAHIESSFGLRMRLIDHQGEVMQIVEQPLILAEPVRHGLYSTSIELFLPSDLAPGEYALQLQVYDLTNDSAVTGFSFRYGDRLATYVHLDTIVVVPTIDEAEELMAEEE